MQSHAACEKAIAALEKSKVSIYLGTELLKRGQYTMLYAQGHIEEASNSCMALMEEIMLQKPTESSYEKLVQRKTLIIDCMFDFVQLHIDGADSLSPTDSVNRLAKMTQAEIGLEELKKILHDSGKEKITTPRHIQRWHFLKGWYYWTGKKKQQAEEHFAYLTEDFFVDKVSSLKRYGKTTFVQNKKK